MVIITMIIFGKRWRKRWQVDDTGSSIGSTIVYSIEQVLEYYTGCCEELQRG